MKKIIAIYSFLLVFSIVLICGCTEEDRFVGTWRTQPVLGISFGIIFNNNGTFSIDGTSFTVGTWELRDGNLVLQIPRNNEPVSFSGTFNYSFSNNDNTLTITSSVLEIILSKQ